MADNTGGLLDFASSPVGMGLLSAAFGGLATARRGAPINSIGAAGLAGVTGYNAATSNALKMQQAQLKLRQMQAMPSLYSTDQNGNSTFDWKSAASLGIQPDDLLKYAQLPNSTKAKVARTVEVPGADGSKQTLQLDEFGRPVGEAINSYVAPQLVDLGGTKQFAIPQAGQSYQVTMSPDQIASNQLGWANNSVAQERNNVLREGNDVQRQAQRTQIVVGSDGNNYLVDKGTGQASPAVTAIGLPIKSGSLAEANAKNSQNMQKLGGMIDEARQILPNSTASGIGAMRDSARRFFGKTSPEAQNAARLGVIGGNMMMMMPRMEGPQSDRDVENYKTMAGKIGDPTVPAEERAAALDTMQAIVNKYSAGTQQSSPQQVPHAASQGVQRTILRTGTDAQGRKVIQYSDGSIEHAN